MKYVVFVKQRHGRPGRRLELEQTWTISLSDKADGSINMVGHYVA
jgi:hypothetical protein